MRSLTCCDLYLVMFTSTKAEHRDAPIIFISAKDTDINRIVGLQLGSDDYLVKPFMHQELILRVKRVLERTYAKNGTIDEDNRTIKENECMLRLTTKETDF